MSEERWIVAIMTYLMCASVTLTLAAVSCSLGSFLSGTQMRLIHWLRCVGIALAWPVFWTWALVDFFRGKY